MINSGDFQRSPTVIRERTGAEGVEIVVSDGSRSYPPAIAQYLPDARHVLDRFHVARWFTEGLTLVRRELQHRPADQRPPTYEPDLFRARFTLLRRADHLTEAHQAHLDRLFDTHPRLRTARDAHPGALCQIYEAENLDEANAALGRFADLYAGGHTPRIPRGHGHHRRLGRRNTGLPHHPAGLQRTTKMSRSSLVRSTTPDTIRAAPPANANPAASGSCDTIRHTRS